MHVRIKNCGLKTPEAIDQAVATGAHFVGFVHCGKSPRHLELPDIKKLLNYTGNRAKTVVVTIDPDDALVNAIMDMKPDYLQVHKASTSRVRSLHAHMNIPLIVGIGIHSEVDVAEAHLNELNAEHLLLDNQQSGSGVPFDWNLIKHLDLKKDWFLAGGLTVENVAEALRTSNAPMVDVSSGLEEPMGSGNKSLEKIAAFNHAVLHAAHG